jgi:F1F0 ATPase subunit 2
MDERQMTELSPLITLPASFLGGLLLGYIYFAALRATANLLTAQGHPLLGIALAIGRLSLITAGLYLAVLAGAIPLLAALAGILCAKALMLRGLPR